MCNKNKQIDHISNIISKGHSAFTENFTIFLIKFTKFTIQIYHSNLRYFRKLSLGDYIDVTFIS